jgi:hypothetical protein
MSEEFRLKVLRDVVPLKMQAEWFMPVPGMKGPRIQGYIPGAMDPWIKDCPRLKDNQR